MYVSNWNGNLACLSRSLFVCLHLQRCSALHCNLQLQLANGENMKMNDDDDHVVQVRLTTLPQPRTELTKNGNQLAERFQLAVAVTSPLMTARLERWQNVALMRRIAAVEFLSDGARHEQRKGNNKKNAATIDSNSNNTKCNNGGNAFGISQGLTNVSLVMSSRVNNQR